jgi:uncharacterized protein YjbI with pentapeptide repeats
MRPRTLTVLAAAGLAVAAPVAFAGQQSTTIGTGAKTCVLGPGADCRGVVHRWTVEHHGNLRKAKFTGAHLHGADFRGADLRGADFRGAKLRHADLRGAKLKGARFDVPHKVESKRAGGGPSCAPNCPGADLSHANLRGAILNQAGLHWANLDGSALYGAWFVHADVKNMTLGNSTVGWGQADWTGAFWCETVTPGVLNDGMCNQT